MKFLIASIILLAVIGLLMAAAFSEELRVEIIGALLGAPATSTPPAPQETGGGTNPAAPSPFPKFIPPGFQGPTTQPHIIGPSGNPPNY